MLRFGHKDPAGQVTVSYQREYTLKDHLGNLRLAYRAGQVRTLLATLEQDQTTHKRESQQFDSLSVSAPVAQATTLARSGQYAARLNAGGSTPQPLGPLTQLGVQKGDTVTVSAFGYYAQPVQYGFFFTLGSFLAGLFHPAQAPPPGFEASRRQDLPLLQVGVAAGLASIPQLSGGVPKGYLRVLVFDKDSALVSQQTQQLSQAAQGGYEPLRLQVRLPQDGYMSAYVGNESDVDVLFDDVQVEHRPGLQVQETQYDPWGLSLSGLDYSAPGIQGLNKYQFNGKERQTDLGLGWSDYGARFYSSDAPHWNSIDPAASRMPSISPYAYALDNPLRFIDPDGEFPIEINVRSFAPPAFFAFNNWVGDGRGFSTSSSETSRIRQVTSYETTTQNYSSIARGSTSTAIYGGHNLTAQSEAAVDGGNGHGSNINTHLYGNDDAVIPGLDGTPLENLQSPDIDVHSMFNISTTDQKDGNQLLNISGRLTGDQFPAAEAFVNISGTKVFLGVSPARYNPQMAGPFGALFGDRKANMATLGAQIVVNKDGKVVGVMQGGKMVGADVYNKQFTKQNPVDLDANQRENRGDGRQSGTWTP